MPKIHLKPNSPEYAERVRVDSYAAPCDMPGCPDMGDFRAPKDRSLSEYYRFCQRHVTEYNRAWNFFEGMNAKEVEEHILKSLFGDRPTWRYDIDGSTEEKLRQRAWDFYGEGDNPDERASRAWSEYEERGRALDRTGPEFEALAIFGLEPPLDLDKIKARYKELAKKYHPDLNGGSAEAEEQLKKVNMAYTVLKLAFGKFEGLEIK